MWLRRGKGLPRWLSNKEYACNAGNTDTWVQSLGWEDLMGEEMATHSSILAKIIPWTEEPNGLQSMGYKKVRHEWATRQQNNKKKEMFVIAINFKKKYLQSTKRWNKINSFRIFQAFGHFFSFSSICEQICKNKNKQQPKKKKNNPKTKRRGWGGTNNYTTWLVFTCINIYYKYYVKGCSLKRVNKKASSSSVMWVLPLQRFTAHGRSKGNREPS